ncbi:CidA/LrgA family protein [Neobacillus jeddahensis]|uniref:CidA/LrgA family protein n=1 Tax=Neobacillus jeddahensis TaxID=1461580 RepID=UPI00058BDF20|nr:CidA/LrgA family protein [Neobacillus jeddahensis]
MAKKAWRFLIQMVILIAIYQIGNVTAWFLHLPIPGNVIGIILLFVLLWLGVIKIEQIEWATGWLLKHLGFFFIPISVGLMTLGNMFVSNGLAFLAILLVSAFIGLLFAGKTTQIVIMKNDKEKVNYHDHAL